MSIRACKYAAISCIIVTLTGCSTPQEVRNLAGVTAANVGALSAQVERISQESRNLAETRSANIAQLHAVNTELRASYKYDVELTKLAGKSANLQLIDTIKAWGKKIDDIYKSAETAETDRNTAILANQKTIDTKREALAKIAQSLATLAEKESAKDRVRFMAGFAKELKKEIDTQLKSGSEAAKKAKKLLDDIKK